VVSETIDANRTEQQLAELMRYPLGYRNNPRRLPSLRSREEGVVLEGDAIGWGDGQRKSLDAITSITLHPYDRDGDQGPKWARCTIRFEDGASVAITSSGRHGAISNERDAAYSAFLHELHARLDTEARKRVAFQDGITRKGKWMIINALGICAPGAILGIYVAFTTGPIYYLGITVFLAAAGACLLIGGLKDLRSKVYPPDNLPAHALPPPTPPQ